MAIIGNRWSRQRESSSGNNCMKHPHRGEYNPAYPSQSHGEKLLNLNMVKGQKGTILVVPLSIKTDLSVSNGGL